MYKIVYLRCIMEITGKAKRLFGKYKVVSIKRYDEGKTLLVKECDVENVINEYLLKVKSKINYEFENGYKFFNSNDMIVSFKSIDSIKEVGKNYSPNVVDVSSISYDELRKIVTLEQLVELEEYYKSILNS